MIIRIFMIACVCLCLTAPLLAQGPPEASGPHIVRYDAYGWWWYFTDFKRGYVAFIGVDIVEFCNDNFVGSWWFAQDNTPPAEEGLLMGLTKGDDVLASVWPIAIWDGDPCEYILNNPPLAEGTVDAILTDNDIFAADFDHNRKNAYGLSAHGVLIAPDGERMICNAGFRCTYDSDTDEYKCKQKIVLN